jgi:hypothetical protein
VRQPPFGCVAWNKRMLGFQGPAQPSPALGGAFNCYIYLEVKCRLRRHLLFSHQQVSELGRSRGKCILPMS